MDDSIVQSDTDSRGTVSTDDSESVSSAMPLQFSNSWSMHRRPAILHAPAPAIDIAASAEDPTDAAEPLASSPQKWTIFQPPAAIQPVSSSNLSSASNTITIPTGTQLAAAGSLSGRLINQGMVIADGSDSPLYLTGLVSGRGSYSGNFVFTGGFSPGNSPAAVHVDYATLDASNVLTMELAGLTAGNQYDQLLIDDHLTLGGHLDVKLLYGFTPSFGDSFDLFKGDFSGQFSDMTLPRLGNGLRWDTSDLYVGGNIEVVPEPGTLLLLIAGGAVMLRRHRP